MPSRNCKGRIVEWSICHSRRVASLPGAWQKLMYTWILTSVDNKARMEADPHLLKGMLFPRERYATPKRIELWRDEIHAAGLVCVYECNGDTFLQLTQNRQKLVGRMADNSDYPEPPESCDVCGGIYTYVRTDTGSLKGREEKRKKEKGSGNGAPQQERCPYCTKRVWDLKAHLQEKHPEAR